MEKLTLSDGQEIEIGPGAGISRIETSVENYSELEALTTKLKKENLKSVEFSDGTMSHGVYKNMALQEPHFRITDTGSGLKVIFGLRELTEDELRAPQMEQAIAYLTDEQALTVKALYPTLKSLIGKTVDPGTRFTYEDDLYKVITPDPLLIQEQWIPGQGTSAIYSQISAGQAGTLEDPIDVPEDVTSNAFTYVTGKYYRWAGKVYKCERQDEPDGTEHSFVYSPDQLIGKYFTAVEE